MTLSKFRAKKFDADKTRMIGLPYGENNYDNTLSRFHTIPERHERTDGQRDRLPILTSHVSMNISNK